MKRSSRAPRGGDQRELSTTWRAAPILAGLFAGLCMIVPSLAAAQTTITPEQALLGKTNEPTAAVGQIPADRGPLTGERALLGRNLRRDPMQAASSRPVGTMVRSRSVDGERALLGRLNRAGRVKSESGK